MSYQKLNTSRAWKVVPSDNAPIPGFMLKDGTGSATSTGADGFADNTVDFNTAGVKVGMIVVNTANGASAIISGVQGDTILVRAGTNPIQAIGDTYAIYGGLEQNGGAVLYVGTTGNVRVMTAGGDDVVFVAVPAGQFIPVNVVQVFSTDTTASDILALW